MSTALTTTQSLTQFKTHLKNGLVKIAQAAVIYHDAVQADPQAKSKFREEWPSITNQFWARLEAIGAGTMHSALLLDTSAAGNKLRKLPGSTQRKAIEEGVEVLASDGSPLIVKAKNMTADQSRMVFARDHVRDLPEQRAWVESQRVTKKVEAPTRSFEVLRNGSVTLNGTTVTQEDLARALGASRLAKMMIIATK